MKRSILIGCNILFVTIPVCFAQCKKEHNNHIVTNIILYNKPLDTIQFYIQGKWECHYGKGGIAANNIQYYHNYYWSFGSNNRLIQSYNGATTTDTAINWIKELGTYTNGDSTFIMSFHDKQNVPWVYVVDGIYNDTLILHNNYSDAIFYHFTKSN